MDALSAGSFRLFVDGYKKAILYKPSDDTSVKALRKSGYPYTKLIPGYIMFFQSPAMRDEFEKEAMVIRRELNISNGPKFIKGLMPIIGKYLGLPPTAIDRMTPIPGQPTDFDIDYYGIIFTTGRDLVVDNLKWLKNNYKIPKDYPGKITVVDKAETVYYLKPADITKFKPVPHNMIFPNRLCEIFLVTIDMEVIQSEPVYNGFDVKAALKAVRENKNNNPRISVWLCDEKIATYTKDNLSEFKTKYDVKTK